MNSLLPDMVLALWFGILTSISPCPLATNIAAVSFIGKRIGKSSYVLSAGLLYTLGRTVTYVALGAFLVSGTQAIPSVAQFLQKYMNMLLGPVLIIVGVVLLDILKISFGSGTSLGEKMQGVAQKSGALGAGLLGIVFALSFCPVSAGLFFGSMFAIAVKHSSRFLMPSLFGIGTALPVLGFSLLLAFAAHWVGSAFNKLTIFEKWARMVTGVIFIVVGIYYCLFHLLKL